MGLRLLRLGAGDTGDCGAREEALLLPATPLPPGAKGDVGGNEKTREAPATFRSDCVDSLCALAPFCAASPKLTKEEGRFKDLTEPMDAVDTLRADCGGCGRAPVGAGDLGREDLELPGRGSVIVI